VDAAFIEAGGAAMRGGDVIWVSDDPFTGSARGGTRGSYSKTAGEEVWCGGFVVFVDASMHFAGGANVAATSAIDAIDARACARRQGDVFS